MTVPILPGWGDILGQNLQKAAESFAQFSQERATKKALEALSKAEKNIVINRQDGTAKTRFTLKDGTVVSIDGSPEEAMQIIAKQSAGEADQGFEEFEQTKPVYAQTDPIAAPTPEQFKLPIPEQARAFLMRAGVDVTARENAMYQQAMERWQMMEAQRQQATAATNAGLMAPLQYKAAELGVEGAEQQLAAGEYGVIRADLAKQVGMKMLKGIKLTDFEVGVARALNFYQDPDAANWWAGISSTVNGTLKRFSDLQRMGVNIEQPTMPEVREMLNNRKHPAWQNLREAERKIAIQKHSAESMQDVARGLRASVDAAVDVIKSKKGDKSIDAETVLGVEAMTEIAALGNFLDIPNLAVAIVDEQIVFYDASETTREGAEPFPIVGKIDPNKVWTYPQLVRRINAKASQLRSWEPGVGEVGERRPVEGSVEAVDSSIKQWVSETPLEDRVNTYVENLRDPDTDKVATEENIRVYDIEGYIALKRRGIIQ